MDSHFWQLAPLGHLREQQDVAAHCLDVVDVPLVLATLQIHVPMRTIGV